MFVSHQSLNVGHLVTAFYCWGKEKKWCYLAKEEMQERTYMAVTEYGTPLSPVVSLKYPGEVLSSGEDDSTAVVHNLCNAQQKWAQHVSE